MADRRTLLRGLAALPALAAAPAAASSPADPIIVLREKHLALTAFYERDDVSDEASRAAFDEQGAIVRRAMRTRTTTVPGAIVAIEWAIAEFRDRHITGIASDVLILALLDGALAVLRRQGGREGHDGPPLR